MTIDQLKHLLLTWRDPSNIMREPDYVSDVAHAHVEKMEFALLKCVQAMYSWRKDDANAALKLAFEAMVVTDLPSRAAGSRTGSAAKPRQEETPSGLDCIDGPM